MPLENSKSLSIIIPVFNEINFLYRLFEQIKLYFNNKNIEIIFVDDGSTDGSTNILEKLKKKKNYKFSFKLIKIITNSGKGKAIQIGIKESQGEYILLQDADLELDTIDAKEMYDIITKNKDIKCLFGSRYLSGKLKKNNYFFNNLIGKINTLIFNIFFSQSLSDVHCGLKILHRSVVEKINLSINDFGIEIDLASQIVRSDFFIYEYGISYFFRSKEEGKKITWIDGLKSFYYLFKVRFFHNSYSTNLSVIYSSIYMAFVGSFFGMGLGNALFIILFLIIGSIIGINFKILSSSIIFLCIYVGSLFGKGNGTTLAVVIFFIIGLFIARRSKKYFLKSKFSKFF
ncbi:glycosyltransferase family 2 protein [Pelagibacteraceae bacterium]|nr:glycosyltransferase family 2 protein [Pelagibacteraceae bacterium]